MIEVDPRKPIRNAVKEVSTGIAFINSDEC